MTLFTRYIRAVLFLVPLCLCAQQFGQTKIERTLAAVEEHFQALDQERRQREWDEQRRFLDRAREFVLKWNEFAEEYTRGEFNLRHAREVSQAFRRLERAAGWPKNGGGKTKRVTTTPTVPARRSGPERASLPDE